MWQVASRNHHPAAATTEQHRQQGCYSLKMLQQPILKDDAVVGALVTAITTQQAVMTTLQKLAIGENFQDHKAIAARMTGISWH